MTLIKRGIIFFLFILFLFLTFAGMYEYRDIREKKKFHVYLETT